MNTEQKLYDTFEAVGENLYYGSPEAVNVQLEQMYQPTAIVYLLGRQQLNTYGAYFRERLQIAAFFVEPVVYDDEERGLGEVIDRCKQRAYRWLHSLYTSRDFRLVQIGDTQRVYDEFDTIVTGFAVNVTLEEIQGTAMPCEDVLKVKRWGEFSPLMIFDGNYWQKVRANA